MTQPQLIHVAINISDIVYTPDYVAKDMADWFHPDGSILEPSIGDGVFLRYLPAGTDWCEIEKGRDFFSWSNKVDWLFGNPPYSLFGKWMRHSIGIADDIVYLTPLNKPFNSGGLFREILRWGGISHVRYYPGLERIRWAKGWPVAAIHYSRKATCTTYSVFERSMVEEG